MCGPMGISRLLLWRRKCECGMSIALIIVNPQRMGAPQHDGRERPNPSSVRVPALCWADTKV